MARKFFYLLQEVSERLNKTEEELKQIVKQGKLQDYRDGSNTLLRADEVEALVKKRNIVIQPKVPLTKPQFTKSSLRPREEPSKKKGSVKSQRQRCPFSSSEQPHSFLMNNPSRSYFSSGELPS